MTSSRAYAQERLRPGVTQAHRDELFDRDILRKTGEIGQLGSAIEGYGFAGVNHVC